MESAVYKSMTDLAIILPWGEKGLSTPNYVYYSTVIKLNLINRGTGILFFKLL
jgi:hypothetical protein